MHKTLSEWLAILLTQLHFKPFPQCILWVCSGLQQCLRKEIHFFLFLIENAVVQAISLVHRHEKRHTERQTTHSCFIARGLSVLVFHILPWRYSKHSLWVGRRRIHGLEEALNWYYAVICRPYVKVFGVGAGAGGRGCICPQCPAGYLLALTTLDVCLI